MKATLALAAALFSTATCFAARPNIVLIYADDLGYGDVGAYGSTAIPTPNLDRLAEKGMRFTAAYATSAMCTPSRYSLLTGQYAFRNREAQILPGNAPLLIDPKRPTLASVLQGAGYDTGLVGKWHLGLGAPGIPLDWNQEIAPGPREVGFAYSYHIAATVDRTPTVFIENGWVQGLDPRDPIRVSYEGPLDDSPTGLSHPHLLRVQADEQHAKTIVNGISRIGYMTGGMAARWRDEDLPDLFLQKAVEFIEKPRTEPFFLFYATHEPHVPRLPHPRFIGSSGVGVRGDAIVQFDWGVGELMAALAAKGLTENTLVIVSSDNGAVLFDGYLDGAAQQNGEHRHAGPHRGGKYGVLEGSTRLPLIVSWPGTIRPGVSEAIVSQVDLFATLAALTGAVVPEGAAEDSQNLVETLLGRSRVGRMQVVQQGMGLLALRRGPWKFIPAGAIVSRAESDGYLREIVPASGALYFLPEDPEERVNLATKYPEIARELAAALQAERAGPTRP